MPRKQKWLRRDTHGRTLRASAPQSLIGGEKRPIAPIWIAGGKERGTATIGAIGQKKRLGD
jgi:hypothetical protein